MEPILQMLDAQWPELATSPEARRALIRWARGHEVMAGMRDLNDVLESRTAPVVAVEVQRVLARHAPTDQLAVRALLQILLPGLVRLVGTVGHGDPDAPDELVALAWERISTYPSTRRGSVAANVVLDVRKRYLTLRTPHDETNSRLQREVPSSSSLPEDQVIAALQLEEIADARRKGLVSAATFDAIIRTRVGGESLAAVAADSGVTVEVMCQRRWRAERRLRSLPMAG